MTWMIVKTSLLVRTMSWVIVKVIVQVTWGFGVRLICGFWALGFCESVCESFCESYFYIYSLTIDIHIQDPPSKLETLRLPTCIPSQSC